MLKKGIVWPPWFRTQPISTPDASQSSSKVLLKSGSTKIGASVSPFWNNLKLSSAYWVHSKAICLRQFERWLAILLKLQRTEDKKKFTPLSNESSSLVIQVYKELLFHNCFNIVFDHKDSLRRYYLPKKITLSMAKLNFFKLPYNFSLHKILKASWEWDEWSQDTIYMPRYHRSTQPHICLKRVWTIWVITTIKVLRVLIRPKGITNHSNRAWRVLKAVSIQPSGIFKFDGIYF